MVFIPLVALPYTASDGAKRKMVCRCGVFGYPDTQKPSSLDAEDVSSI
jgi:hypothetical protein